MRVHQRMLHTMDTPGIRIAVALQLNVIKPKCKASSIDLLARPGNHTPPIPRHSAVLDLPSEARAGGLKHPNAAQYNHARLDVTSVYRICSPQSLSPRPTAPALMSWV